MKKIESAETTEQITGGQEVIVIDRPAPRPPDRTPEQMDPLPFITS